MKFLVISLMLISMVACTDHRTDTATPLPRRYAYPRFEPYDTATVVCRLADVEFRINAATGVDFPRDSWANVRYGRYGATLHLSYTRPTDDESLAQAIDNRRERMMLNLGDATAEATDYTTPAGFACRELVGADALVTPVQFLAVGPGRRLLSGSVVLDRPDAPADSLAPVLAALHAEVRTLLNSLTTLK